MEEFCDDEITWIGLTQDEALAAISAVRIGFDQEILNFFCAQKISDFDMTLRALSALDDDYKNAIKNVLRTVMLTLHAVGGPTSADNRCVSAWNDLIDFWRGHNEMFFQLKFDIKCGDSLYEGQSFCDIALEKSYIVVKIYWEDLGFAPVGRFWIDFSMIMINFFCDVRGRICSGWEGYLKSVATAVKLAERQNDINSGRAINAPLIVADKSNADVLVSNRCIDAIKPILKKKRFLFQAIIDDILRIPWSGEVGNCHVLYRGDGSEFGNVCIYELNNFCVLYARYERPKRTILVIHAGPSLQGVTIDFSLDLLNGLVSPLSSLS